MVGLTVIVASGGRGSLSRTLGSVVPQLTVYDSLLLVVDQRHPFGHGSRNQMMGWASGTHLAFLDDDEVWMPNAAETIRRVVDAEPDAAHLFRVLGADRATGQIVVPNKAPLARWEGEADGFDRFVAQTGRRRSVVHHSEAIVLVP